MAVTSVETDLDTLTMTVVTEHAVDVRRLWDGYLDPRQIELFWGPPTWPATFLRHDGFVGGVSRYFMTGPDEDVAAGAWDWTALDEGTSFEVTDHFCHPDGTIDESMQTMRMTFLFEPTPTGSRLTNTTFFASAQELKQLREMGMEEGSTQAMGQTDGVLARPDFAPGLPTAATLLDGTRVRVSSVLKADLDDVWRAHRDEATVARWLLGPDGWSMPECTVAQRTGEATRLTWRDEATGRSFSSVSRVLELAPPRREVAAESMAGSPETVNDLTLTPLDGGTLVSIVITYPDRETRDAALGTGMVGGMESSYARLEGLLAGGGEVVH
ncbi:SRPBCC family protein [Tessaracoccus palaemonis]|uniref:SRPBCC domain-containing protein n=1 Tax=Tessaracoccus palaemonis TaxID=2829499 RepID=A0ABX8SLP2_9ACTN|nr:SRPBCC family protein [Tessaracoccus palaemonis]QXT62938.1 SRPBCC domain-containing protein [Tessaracoccus palaemonis]